MPGGGHHRITFVDRNTNQRFNIPRDLTLPPLPPPPTTQEICFYHHSIETLVTSSPSEVETWLEDVEFHFGLSDPYLVGLDVEWRPNTTTVQPPNPRNPVATLQICVPNHCLVFQILHSPSIPESLKEFLDDPTYTFLGVGIEADAEKLREDYNLVVSNTMDLRELAEDVFEEREMRNAGLKTLAERVMEVEFEKPQRITRSRWDDECLSEEQVRYACLDAFVSMEVGRMLWNQWIWLEHK